MGLTTHWVAGTRCLQPREGVHVVMSIRHPDRAFSGWIYAAKNQAGAGQARPDPFPGVLPITTPHPCGEISGRANTKAWRTWLLTCGFP